MINLVIIIILVIITTTILLTRKGRLKTPSAPVKMLTQSHWASGR